MPQHVVLSSFVIDLTEYRSSLGRYDAVDSVIGVPMPGHRTVIETSSFICISFPDIKNESWKASLCSTYSTKFGALFIHLMVELQFNSTCLATANRRERARNNCVIGLECRHLNYERAIFHVSNSTF